MDKKKFLKKFLPGQKYHWRSTSHNAVIIFGCYQDNLLDVVLSHELDGDLYLPSLTNLTDQVCCEIVEKRGFSISFGEDLANALIENNCIASIKKNLKKTILSTWDFDILKFSAGIYLFPLILRSGVLGYAPRYIYKYLLYEKYSDGMYMHLKNNNVLMIDKKRSIDDFIHILDFTTNLERPFQTDFFPRLKLVWELLELPIENFFYLQKNKITNDFEITKIMKMEQRIINS